MKPYVAEVINLWKDSVNEGNSPTVPYKMSSQLRNLAALFAPGLFYYYILDFPKLEIKYIHEGTREILGIAPENVTLEKLIEVLAPEERESLAQKESVVVDFFINFINPEEALYYKSSYFFSIHDVHGQKRDMLHQATILTMTKDQKPEYVMVVHTDVSHLNFVKKNTLSFISLRGDTSYFDVHAENRIFNPNKAFVQEKSLKNIFTSREKQVIKLIAGGYHSEKISEKLSISIHTLRTHRKNILKKTSCNTITELVAKCLLEGII